MINTFTDLGNYSRIAGKRFSFPLQNFNRKNNPRKAGKIDDHLPFPKNNPRKAGKTSD
jgi:hypothetical protein